MSAAVGELETVSDSVFRVHRVPLVGAHRMRSGIVRAALAAGSGERRLAPHATALLAGLEGEAAAVPTLLAELAPDAVLLVGREQPFDLDALDALAVGPHRARVVVVPLLGVDGPLASPGAPELLERADLVATVHPGEQRSVRGFLPASWPGEVAPLDVALTINRVAVRHRLFGVRRYGRYVVLVRGFPPGGPRHLRSVTHEALQHALGKVSVAEVDGDRWRITNSDSTLPLPVNPTQVNLWRLMEHAVATIDVRPPGPFGREAIESMLLGTPVVVPDRSAAMEHVRAAGGGLWYRDHAELLAAARLMLDYPIRDRLSQQAERYAQSRHANIDEFVARVGRLVIGD